MATLSAHAGSCRLMSTIIGGGPSPPGWCEQSRNSTGYPEYEQYAVSPQRIILFTLLPLAPVAVFAFLHSRYRCPNKDPLCRKDRPCIACYLKLFYGPALVFEPPS